MRLFKKIKSKIKSEIRNISLFLAAITSRPKEKVRNEVPYVSQFADPAYAEKILKDGVEKTMDPDWENTGAGSAEEYGEWVLTICGMACASMALQHFKKRREGIVTLAKEARKYGVYKQHNNKFSDMHYKEFSDWIKVYGIESKIYTRLSIRGLQKLLSDGKLIMVSVNPNIRGYETADHKQRGGHLVLITGYDNKLGTITFHNPSGFVSQNTQENHTVSTPYFLNYYAGRGMALSSS